MKIELLREDLLYAVNAVERAVSTKNTLPVLSGIMISAHGNQLSFRATDLEIAIELSLIHIYAITRRAAANSPSGYR